MKTNDSVIACGEFSLQVYESGKLVSNVSASNLVVTLGQKNIARLIGGDSAGKPFSKIGVGTSPIAPVLSNTTLTNMFSKNLVGATYPDENSVLFSFDIDSTEANGMTITEFGLLNGDNILCARKITGEIIKTNAVRLVGTWKITIN